jgi:hypothetical protein
MRALGLWLAILLALRSRHAKPCAKAASNRYPALVNALHRCPSAGRVRLTLSAPLVTQRAAAT